MKRLKSFFIISLLFLPLNDIYPLQNNNEHEYIIKLIEEADEIKFSIKYKIDDSRILGSKDGVEVAAIDSKFTTLNDLMLTMGKYFSVEAAMLEIEKIGLCVINDKIGAFMADGEEGFYISDDSTFEFVIDEDEIKLVKIMMASDVIEGEKKAFYYKLKKLNQRWKIVDETPEIYYYNKNNWVIIHSSSYLCGMDIPYRKYSEDKVLDKNINTVWVEGAPDDGIDEWVEFSFCLPITISNIGIINGYAKSKDIYEANNRVKRLKVIVNNEVYFEAELKNNIIDFQSINLPNKISVERIKLIILDVYRGNKYRDTCISEIKFY